MNDRQERNSEREAVTETNAVHDHGHRLTHDVERRGQAGSDEWRADEEAETDTPENTGSKVGPGRDSDTSV